ncbi:centrosomal protein of 104 kDa-like [Amphibalanus amphitrite]|uniref:centrosomal protein of 104 kDa-like n=1 Tax=Amphibalanus amphitrite TaxID=1232801 RepID=UPI001C919A7F|nr:centrosomal protein of 104 kDa-like [Amphibalanus amphitrite]
MSPTRLNYHVCFNTSEDTEHPAKELDVQAPHSRGWRSRQFCIYPQEIAFQLGERTHLSRIQVLLHQLLIPERIDFFVGDVERGKDETYANARFAKLGYISLGPADDVTGGKAREFKSVAVDCEGRFIKLLIHRNHMSKANKYNQVSILGVNFLGDVKEANNNTVMPAPERSGSAMLTQDGVSSYDDLAFNMYTDYEAVKWMRKLEARKAVAAKHERFDYAQNCKDAVELLQKAGLRLGKYEIEKRLAIEEENYDKAKQKKEHIDEYRQAVREALKVEQLMEDDGTNSNNDILMRLELPPPPGKKARPPSPPPPGRPQSDPLPPIPRSPERPPTEPKKPLTPPPPLFPTPESSGPALPPPPPPPSYDPAPAAASPVPGRQPAPATAERPPTPPQPASKYALYEDRTLPAIRGKRLAATAGVQYAERRTEMSPHLTDQDRKQASLPIEVFGEPLVGNFYAKSFAQKEEGLRLLQSTLRAGEGGVKPDKVTRAATLLLQRSLRDKVYTVFQLTAETLDYLTGPYASKHKTSRRELSTAMETLLPELIQKTGDNATRVQSLAVETLVRLAEVAHARQIPVVAAAMTAPLNGAVSARIAQARLEVVEQMVTKHGLSSEPDSAMSVKAVAQLGLSAVENPHETVRAAGTRLMILIYPEDRALVRRLLPTDTKTRKSLTYRTLISEFDKMDKKLERRSSSTVPAVLSLDGPAPLHEVADGQQAELSRAVRSKSLASVITDVEQPMEQDEDDRTCVFCGDINDKYVTDDGMEYHFWKHCPMLLRCKNCKQVVEVASYTEHLLSECKDHENYRYCKTCHEAIPVQDYDAHIYANNCKPGRSGPAGNRCPLCHQNTPPYDAGWRSHLVAECPANPRNNKLSSALVRLHGHSRGAAARSPPTSQQPPPPAQQSQRPSALDSGKSRTAPSEEPADQRQPRRELVPPTSDMPGRFSFSSDAPAYLRQPSRSSSMADLREIPLALPPRRHNSTSDLGDQPTLLGRNLRDRQSPPEGKKREPSPRRTPPKSQMTSREARQQISTPREDVVRSSSRNRDRNQTRQNNDQATRPSGRSPAATTPREGGARDDKRRLERDQRDQDPSRQKRDRDDRGRDRNDRHPPPNSNPSRPVGGTARDNATTRTPGRDPQRRTEARKSGGDGNRSKQGGRDDRKTSERDRGSRLNKDDSAGSVRSRRTGEERVKPAPVRGRSQSQKPSGRTELRAARLSDTRRSKSVTRNTPPRRR